ncbi:MAG: coproporphyrinogen-III oxidase family protein, partial [Anaerolineae bacterium]
MPSPDEIGLYIHIPFCRAKCAYCDFNSYAGLEHLFDGYTRALVQEMRTVGRMLQTPAVRFKVETIYLGGGTPTALPLTLLIDILRALRQVFLPASDIEITIEANPGAVGKGYLASLLDEGVNRLSLGVQSFDDDFLRLLRRIHTADEARASYRLARQAGFDNINFDLIYALPGQTLTAWQD